MGTDPINNKQLGGVTYNANQFDAQELGNGRFQLTAKKGGEKLIFNQQQQTEVKVRAGQHDYYRYSDGSQSEHASKYIDGKSEAGIPMKKAKPRIEMSTDKGLFVDDNNFTISDMMGATFTSSTKTVANVTVKDSSNVKVDLAANDSTLFGDTAIISDGENNVVKMDSKDIAKINSVTVEGEGTAAQKDYE